MICGTGTVELEYVVGWSKTRQDAQDRDKNTQWENWNNRAPDSDLKGPPTGYRDRNVYVSASTGACPKEGFSFGGLTLFVRGSAGFGPGVQGSASVTIDPFKKVDWDAIIKGSAAEFGYAANIYGASIEVGGGVSGSFCFKF